MEIPCIETLNHSLETLSRLGIMLRGPIDLVIWGRSNRQIWHIIGKGGRIKIHDPVRTGAKKMLREFHDRLAYWSGVRLVSVAAAGLGARRRLKLGDYRVSAPRTCHCFQVTALRSAPIRDAQQLVS